LGGEGVDDPEGEVRAGEIVRQQGVAGRLPGLVGDLPVQDQIAVVVPDDERRAGLGQLLPVTDGHRQRLGHRLAALDGGGAGRVGAGGVDAGKQLGLRGEQHTGLAERGQYLLDVAQKRRVGADDQHRSLGEQFALLVQQEGGAVQRHGRLAGAGAALHDQHTAVRGADDGVLLGLDGPHDVAHAAGARGVQRGQQHTVAVGVLEAGAFVVGEVQDLVVQFGDRAALGGDVAAPPQTHRGVPGGEVERAGHRRPPVDQQRGALGVGRTDADAADMVRRAAGQIDPAEAQRAVHRVERGQQAGALGDPDVAFEPRLEAGADRGQRVLDASGGDRAQGVDPGMDPVDEFLLFPQFGAFPD
jgi:hypothetical protein